MGCTGSGVDNTKAPQKKETVFGILEVKVLSGHIDHETSRVFSMDPYVKVKFSNQKFDGAVVKKGGK
jgi:hypothetical protein